MCCTPTLKCQAAEGLKDMYFDNMGTHAVMVWLGMAGDTRLLVLHVQRTAQAEERGIGSNVCIVKG